MSLEILNIKSIQEKMDKYFEAHTKEEIREDLIKVGLYIYQGTSKGECLHTNRILRNDKLICVYCHAILHDSAKKIESDQCPAGFEEHLASQKGD